VEKSICLEDLENELEAYAPVKKCETKCEKTYYKCPMRNRFECPMIVRTVREVVTGSILIETCVMSHCHDDSNEKFQRGLSFRVQESIREIKSLISRSGLELFMGIYSWIPIILVEKMFPTSKIVSYLHRIRACTSSSYMEYNVSGLCAMIEARQCCESSNNTSKVLAIEPAEKSIQFAGSENSRLQAISPLKYSYKMYNEYATLLVFYNRLWIQITECL
jgi:hypothetical protein